MAFFGFTQNNSGGRFSFYPESGVSHYVIIEAHSADEANRKAEEIGLYFDGYGDCECCGDRWNSTYGKGDVVPSIYGEPYERVRFGPYPLHMKWIDGPEGYIHYADGRIVAFGE